MESKHHKLARSLRSGPSDHDLKPNAATRDQLNVNTTQRLYLSAACQRLLNDIGVHPQIIVSYPPTKQLSSEEQDLVWKFRYYLTTQEKVGVLVLFHLLTCISACHFPHSYSASSVQALTKFLKCVNWDLPQEAKQALELLGKWKPMDVEDSLELLSSHFTNPTVRRYAVARLQQADDEVHVTC